MVNAHLSQMQDSGYVHAIFKSEDGFRVSTDQLKIKRSPLEEVKEQMLFANRNTITKLLLGFLQQRKVALKNHPMGDVAANLYDVIYSSRLKHFDELMRIIKYQYPKFLKVMPSDLSRFHNNYKSKIEPILLFCIGKELNGG
ncbi:MAG: hypothetical protein EOO86_07505 [Pedobacter sp.]|nr:MAG: hypothetical protein EOO86_07505 [Pedobacter sp.]